LIINWDHEGQSFVVAFDKRTGKQRWKVAREEVTSWATPIVVEHGGKPQVIISGTNRVRGYDLAGGNVIWECGGLSRNIVASPVAAGDRVYVVGKNGVTAVVRAGAEFGVIAQNTLNDEFTASPAIAGGEIYLRGHKSLYCLAAD